MGRRRGSCAFAALIFIVGCGEEGGGPAGPGPGGDALTYYRDVKPILDANCVSCHSAGGIAPFELTSFDDVYLRRELVAFVVAERIMPPWPAADDCTEYTNDRGLEQAQIDAIVSW